MRSNQFQYLILLLFLSQHQWAQTGTVPDLLKVGHQELVSNADLHYTQPVSRSEEGMPVGNGRMGSLVWTSPQSFHLQINRVDIFGNDATSDNFFERNTDYCGGAGFVDLDFLHAEKPAFSGKDFSQHLSCYDGLVTIESEGIKIETLAWHEQDVMAVRLSGENLDIYQVLARLRMLRPPVVKTGDHNATSTLKLGNNQSILHQQFTEEDYYCGSAVVMAVEGRPANIGLENKTGLRTILASGNEAVTVFIASAASFDPDEDVIASAQKQLEAARKKGFDGMLQSNREWWKSFWEKSFVHLHSEDGTADLVEQNYTYFLYVMASSSQGKLPPKFNGMIWSTDGDSRKWGNLYWGANQSCLYNGLFPANRPELMTPFFNMYSGMYESCQKAAIQQWGSKGLFIPETVSFSGLPELPEEIAAEMRQLYLVQKPWEERSQQFVDYAETKMPFLSRWNWKKDIGWKDGNWQFTDKGGQTFGHVTHIFSRGAKIAYQYWMQYEYTLDRKWLEERAYPMVKGVAEFYRNFPNLKKEADGKYHIRHINDNESIWGGHNTIEEMSSMYGILPVAIRASEILNTDADLRDSWKELLANLSPMPVAEINGNKIWIRSLEPVVQGEGNRVPDPNTMPVWFFDLCNLESPPEMQDVANATFDRYFPNGPGEQSKIYVLSKLPVVGSILGRKESTRWLIPNQVKTAEIEVMPNRMTLREGYQTTGVQRLGRVTDALHLALLQSAPAGTGLETVIRLFPAWPDEWEGSFKLLARGGFLVTSSFKNGQVEFAEIVSQAGADCMIRNPWPGQAVDLYRNGKKQALGEKPLFKIKTAKGERFILVRGSTKPEEFRQ
jgi:hypothetical protein